MTKEDASNASISGKPKLNDDGEKSQDLMAEMNSLTDEVKRLTDDKNHLEDQLSRSRKRIAHLEATQNDLLKRLDGMEDMILAVLNQVKENEIDQAE